jgi:hypothetical protein
VDDLRTCLADLEREGAERLEELRPPDGRQRCRCTPDSARALPRTSAVVLAVGLVCRHLPYLHPELANAYQVAASGPAAPRRYESKREGGSHVEASRRYKHRACGRGSRGRLVRPGEGWRRPGGQAGSCSGSATWKLKAKVDGGVIETEFEVDQNVAGKKWRVVIRQNGVKRFSRIKTTKAPSGSFTVHKLLDNKAGADRIVGKATALSSGQTCRGVLRI